MDFTVEPIINENLDQKLKHKIDTKTKPIGALGTLEDIAFQIGRIQNTDKPKLNNPTIVVFAGDHGIAKKGEVNPGSDIVAELHANGSNIIGFGEMGIGNTSSASLLMAYFTKTPISACIGMGTGTISEGLQTKKRILTEVYEKYNPSTAVDALICYGGFEITMITGAILKAAELKMTVVVDGFIVTAAFLAAHHMHPQVIDYCIFAHNSGEQGHQKMLKFLNKKPLINLGMRLGEGTGAAIAYPIIVSAVEFLNKMASFESAGVSESEH